MIPAEARALFRTTSFRVAVAFALFFAGAAALLMAGLYVATVGRLAAETDAAVRREMSALIAIQREEGAAGLNAAVIERSSGEEFWLYVLVQPNGQALSGNLDAAPVDLSAVRRPAPDVAPTVQQASFARFEFERPALLSGLPERRSARGLFIAFEDGYGVFVGRDLGDGAPLVQAITQAIGFGAAGTIAMALIGGLLVARQAARRADELSQTARAVMGGNLRERALVRGRGDEFDRLAQDMNAMLDRIERLIQAARTTGDSVAHDLRSPLARLRARLESALAADPRAQQAALGDAVEAIDDIIATFNAVLRLSRLESGQGGRLEACDAGEIARGMGELFEPAFEDKNLAFATEITDHLTLMADRALLQQALTNLLDNAIKYTPEGGGVTLRARRTRAGAVELSVTDTGPGIPEADRARALDRFVRLDSARTAPGAGIGLSLAVAVAELHGGRLELSDGAGGPQAPGLRAALILPGARP
jgi:signal transduction histidine kinase